MSVIPELPHSYTSDPYLKFFLKLLIKGLSDSPSARPGIESFNKHPFLKEKAVGRSVVGYEEREYFEIVKSIVGGDYVKW